LLAGCGGGTTAVLQPIGGATPTPSPSTSPSPSPSPSLGASQFAGTWSGTYLLNPGQVEGLVSVTISDDGTVSGVAYNSETNQEEGPVNGTVDDDGTADITFLDGGFQFSGEGTLSLNGANDRLSGTLTRIFNGSSVGTVTVTLTRGGLQL
jgi:hypothetical protein